ncbi:uncharacterized protein BP01DRAFT_287759 [Aspergillus saccharolyticus JOP 1030-1]|uniref:Zn(2)-C6 fungal-type domain-containing protein n=1 Tax=Aspergillus saccharolyticus JOP 1030-1 TaxID=1450539 RepID=A0A319ABT7_9EURO|nr:hypothetical protein BP01DRAFT_287759 [Aspergillus saccharolyticus JOP 1030-1]PYH49128.1 hypothetical protein BP01DRAFT_287759 [Aspergillus saccharolyticus JOP 1030-1]
MTDTAITRLQNTLKCDLARKNRIQRACLLKRLSQWLWSIWVINSPETPAALIESTDRSKFTSATCATRKAPFYAYPVPDRPPADTPSHDSQSGQSCKACKAWGVPCDQVRPRCSHCLDQQILCFYVGPTRKATRKSIRSTKHNEVIDPTPRLQQEA